jgi:hypothetical protein
LDQSLGPHFLGKSAALRLCTYVTPDQRRADNVIFVIQHDGAMHLPGKADAGDVVPAQSGIRECIAHGQAAGSPPIGWILLGPSDLRRGKRGMLLRRGTKYPALVAEDQSPRPAGADINAK